jgi:universal stress protein A
MTIKRILVPTDFSEPSLKALDYAIDFTRAHDAELLLLHVVEPIRHTRMITDVSEILEHHRAEAAEKIAELEQRTRRHHRKCRSEVHFGVPYSVIADVAKKWNADLIIIATHGYTGLHHLLLGSVTERVVRIAQCPVMTLKVGKALAAGRRRRVPKRASKSPRRH